VVKRSTVSLTIPDGALNMNRLDASAYRLCIPFVEYLTKDKTPTERLEFIGNVAIACCCHIVIVGHYYAELYGYTPEIKAKIARDMLFYHIDEVIGLKEIT